VSIGKWSLPISPYAENMATLAAGSWVQKQRSSVVSVILYDVE
jgi:hypothetical protein